MRERESKGWAGKSRDEDGEDNKEKSEAGKEDIVENVGVQGEKQSNREAAVLRDAEPSLEPRRMEEQEVYVLDGGFVKWQEM